MFKNTQIISIVFRNKDSGWKSYRLEIMMQKQEKWKAKYLHNCSELFTEDCSKTKLCSICEMHVILYFQDRSAIISSPPSSSERNGEGEGGEEMR